MEQETYEEVLDEYTSWNPLIHADIDCIIWWLKVIVRMMLVLNKRHNERKSWNL